MTEKYLYATKYQLYLAVFLTIILLGGLGCEYLVKPSKDAIVPLTIVALVMLVVLILTWLSYKGKIPVARLKENGKER